MYGRPLRCASLSVRGWLGPGLRSHPPLGDAGYLHTHYACVNYHGFTQHTRRALERRLNALSLHGRELGVGVWGEQEMCPIFQRLGSGSHGTCQPGEAAEAVRLTPQWLSTGRGSAAHTGQAQVYPARGSGSPQCLHTHFCRETGINAATLKWSWARPVWLSG